MTIERLLSIVAVLVSLLSGAVPAYAGDDDDGGHTRMCPAPLMVCANDAGTPDGCPRGYDCTCVPSCPQCRDCAARVCVVSARPEPECRTACDCDPGLGCFDHQCIAGFAPVFCCENDRCPAGEQCQHRNGRMDRCRAPEPECRTACDCESGQGCFDGQCTVTDVPVYCCGKDRCPAGFPCQNRDGSEGQCRSACADQTWICDAAGNTEICGDNRICACTASCPSCEDCGQPVCVPPNLGTNPYRCNDDGSCDREGDRCTCASSCPACDDCRLGVCVPGCAANDDRCEKRTQKIDKFIEKMTKRARRCVRDEDCRRVDTNTECQGTCGVFVNRRHAPLVGRAVRYLDHKVCSMYQDDGCPYAEPGCEASEPACVEGLCTGRAPVNSTD